jgi:subtilisin family serine protease
MRRRAAVLLRSLVLLGLVAPGSLGASPFSTETSQARLAAPAVNIEAGDPSLGSRHARPKQSRKQGRNAERNARDTNRQSTPDRRQDGRRPMEMPSGRLPAALTAGPGEKAATAAANTDEKAGPLSAEDRYIVVLEESSGNSMRTASAMAADSAGVIPTYVYHNVFNGFAAVIPDQQLDAVRGDPRVKAVVPDRVVHAFKQTRPTGVDRIDADQNATAGIDGRDERVDVDVAVLDTAGNDTHPDLNVFASTNCTNSPIDSDDDGHGTHVGGTIGALDNDIGVVGVAPGARLWNVRVLKNGWGYDSWIICGLDFVAEHAGEIEVANLSLGGGGSDSNCQTNVRDLFHQAFCRTVAAGVTVVVAAGNESSNAARHTPAAYDEVITVSALADSDGLPGGVGAATSAGPDDSLAQFSNFGADVDIAAPGVSILSTVPGGYARFSGTSMASPHVAGAAALYLADHPGATPAQVRTALLGAREMLALPGDRDGIAEGVLYAGDGSAPTHPPVDPAPQKHKKHKKHKHRKHRRHRG